MQHIPVETSFETGKGHTVGLKKEMDIDARVYMVDYAIRFWVPKSQKPLTRFAGTPIMPIKRFFLVWEMNRQKSKTKMIG